jgi:hypothetical protein
MGRSARLLVTLAVGAIALAAAPTARAQALRDYAARDYLVSYQGHARGYCEESPMVPQLAPGSAWASLAELLPGRSPSAHGRLYLLGGDQLHLVPTRLGVLGWGVSAGVAF